MRISDWSSDVCSSDLRLRPRRGGDPGHIRGKVAGILRINCGAEAPPRPSPGRELSLALRSDRRANLSFELFRRGIGQFLSIDEKRSEERRVGKECVSELWSWWWPSH